MMSDYFMSYYKNLTQALKDLMNTSKFIQDRNKDQ